MFYFYTISNSVRHFGAINVSQSQTDFKKSIYNIPTESSLLTCCFYDLMIRNFWNTFSSLNNKAWLSANYQFDPGLFHCSIIITRSRKYNFLLTSYMKQENYFEYTHRKIISTCLVSYSWLKFQFQISTKILNLFSLQWQFYWNRIA